MASIRWSATLALLTVVIALPPSIKWQYNPPWQPLASQPQPRKWHRNFVHSDLKPGVPTKLFPNGESTIVKIPAENLGSRSDVHARLSGDSVPIQGFRRGNANEFSFRRGNANEFNFNSNKQKRDHQAQIIRTDPDGRSVPMELIATKGNENRAKEQLRLLEAALSSPKATQSKNGKLPRVFIAPSNIPPPPGYVKIPLVPQNGVKNNRLKTFLSHNTPISLSRGFVRLSLPSSIPDVSKDVPLLKPNQFPQNISTSQINAFTRQFSSGLNQQNAIHSQNSFNQNFANANSNPTNQVFQSENVPLRTNNFFGTSNPGQVRFRPDTFRPNTAQVSTDVFEESQLPEFNTERNSNDFFTTTQNINEQRLIVGHSSQSLNNFRDQIKNNNFAENTNQFEQSPQFDPVPSSFNQDVPPRPFENTPNQPSPVTISKNLETKNFRKVDNTLSSQSDITLKRHRNFNERPSTTFKTENRLPSNNILPIDHTPTNKQFSNFENFDHLTTKENSHLSSNNQNLNSDPAQVRLSTNFGPPRASSFEQNINPTFNVDSGSTKFKGRVSFQVEGINDRRSGGSNDRFNDPDILTTPSPKADFTSPQATITESHDLPFESSTLFSFETHKPFFDPTPTTESAFVNIDTERSNQETEEFVSSGVNENSFAENIAAEIITTEYATTPIYSTGTTEIPFSFNIDNIISNQNLDNIDEVSNNDIELSTTTPIITPIITTPTPAAKTTLFPPFSVAKRRQQLNRKQTADDLNSSTNENSFVFGRRIKPRGRNQNSESQTSLGKSFRRTTIKPSTIKPRLNISTRIRNRSRFRSTTTEQSDLQQGSESGNVKEQNENLLTDSELNSGKGLSANQITSNGVLKTRNKLGIRRRRPGARRVPQWLRERRRRLRNKLIAEGKIKPRKFKDSRNNDINDLDSAASLRVSITENPANDSVPNLIPAEIEKENFNEKFTNEEVVSEITTELNTSNHEKESTSTAPAIETESTPTYFGLPTGLKPENVKRSMQGGFMISPDPSSSDQDTLRQSREYVGSNSYIESDGRLFEATDILTMHEGIGGIDGKIAKLAFEEEVPAHDNVFSESVQHIGYAIAAPEIIVLHTDPLQEVQHSPSPSEPTELNPKLVAESKQHSSSQDDSGNTFKPLQEDKHPTTVPDALNSEPNPVPVIIESSGSDALHAGSITGPPASKLLDAEPKPSSVLRNTSSASLDVDPEPLKEQSIASFTSDDALDTSSKPLKDPQSFSTSSNVDLKLLPEDKPNDESKPLQVLHHSSQSSGIDLNSMHDENQSPPPSPQDLASLSFQHLQTVEDGFRKAAETKRITEDPSIAPVPMIITAVPISENVAKEPEQVTTDVISVPISEDITIKPAEASTDATSVLLHEDTATEAADVSTDATSVPLHEDTAIEAADVSTDATSVPLHEDTAIEAADVSTDATPAKGDRDPKVIGRSTILETTSSKQKICFKDGRCFFI